MKKIRFASLAVCFGIALLFSGCGFVSTPATGMLFTGTKAPVLATGDALDPSKKKVGEATCTIILGVAYGDCSIETATKNGNIKKVHSVDSETFNVLGIYATYKVIVTGE